MTYYENVRVPAEMIVGEENAGWKLITLQLNHERIGLAAFGSAALGIYEEVLDWSRATEAEDGRPVASRPWVQMSLAEAYARLQALKVMNWRIAWELDQGRLDPADASSAKVYGSETLIEVYRLLLEVLGPAGALRKGSAGDVLAGNIGQEARACQINTFGGGVNEVQREIIAMAGLHMPRAPR